MNEVSFPSAASAALPRARLDAATSPPAEKPEPAPSETRAGNAGNTADIPNQFKVKTDFRSAHSFTYTFFDTKTLELIGSWPQQPTYRLAAQRIEPGAALQAIA